MRKIIVFILLATITLTNVLGVFSSEEYMQDITIFAPPKGVAAQHILSDTEKIYNADNVPNGVYINKNKLALDGSSITTGNFTLKETESEQAACDAFVMNERFFEDFEDAEANALANTARLEKLDGSAASTSLVPAEATTIVLEDASGNNYVDACTAPFTINLGDGTIGNNYMTVSAKIKREDNVGGIMFTLMGENGAYLADLRLRARTGNVMSYYDSNGAYTRDTVEPYNPFPIGTWAEFRVTLDFTQKTYSAYINDVIVCDNWKMITQGATTLNSVACNYMMDDIAIYSGEKTEVAIVSEMPSNVTVSQENITLFPFKSEVAPFGVVPEWSSNTEGIEIQNGYFSVSPATASGEVILTASGFGKTEEYTVSLSNAIEENFENDSVGGSVKEENGNKYFDGNLSRAVSASGRVMLNANIKGNGNVTLSENSGSVNAEIETEDDEWHKLSIYADLQNATYMVILDDSVIDEGPTEADTITDITTSGISIDDIYLGNVCETAPRVLDVTIDGMTLDGETVSPSYSFFSVLDEKEKSVEYEWYIAENKETQGTKISTGDSLKILTEYVGKYLYLGVNCKSETSESGFYYSKPALVQDLFTATKVTDGIRFDINNVLGNNAKMNLFAVLYADGKVSDIYAMSAKMPNGFTSHTLPVLAFYDGAEAFVLDENFVPLATSKKIGSLPDVYEKTTDAECFKEENGKIILSFSPVQPTTMMVFKPEQKGTFKNNFNPDTIDMYISETGASIKDRLAFAGVTETNVKFTHNITDEGVYEAMAVLKDGSTKKAKFGVNFSALFSGEELQKSSEEAFVKIFSNFTDLSSQELKKLYKAYSAIENKENVGAFMAAENHKMNLLESAVYLSAFLEDKDFAEALTGELKEQNIEYSAVELMAKNADFKETANSLIKPCAILDFLKDMKVKAILLGIENSANYLEAKAYIEAACEEEVSDDIAKALNGKSFNSIEEVIEAVSDFEPKKGSSGGGSGGGSVGGKGAALNDNIIAQKADVTAKKQLSFSDLSQNHWAYNYILNLTEKNILNGYDDGKFLPEKSMTRAEYIKMLCIAFGFSGEGEKFEDVASNDWYYDYVSRASAAGIVYGSDGYFKPNDIITREDAALILYRAAEASNISISEENTDIKDINDVSSYAKKAVSALYGAGIINGMDDGSFSPKQTVTRAQAATILARMLVK